MSPLIDGAVLGFSIAAPAGPIGLLVLRRSLSAGARAGLACGLGAASADLCYGALAASGFTLLARFQRTAAALVASTGAASPAWFVAGVFSGSLAWWLLLSTSAAALRGRFPASAMAWVNRLSALVLAVFGLLALARAATPALPHVH